MSTEITKAVRRELQQNKQILYPIRIVEYAHIQKWKIFDSDIGIDIAKKVREYFIPDFSEWSTGSGMTELLHRLIEDLRST